MTNSMATPGWMSDEHQMFADSVRRFLAAEMVPNVEQWRRQGTVDREFWNKAGEAGLLAASIPEAYGGVGAPLSFDALTIYEQGRAGDTGWGFAIQTIVTHYVVACGTEEQKARWLPRLATGELVCALAMTEPGTGSDLQTIKTFADDNGDHYRLNGSKTFITNGQTANLVCVACKTDRSEGAKGISLLMLETDGCEGFRRGRNLEKLGMKSQDTSELFFDEAQVPKSNVLGGMEGRGFYQMMEQLPWERLAIAVTALGQMDFAFGETLAYTNERRAFGKRIAEFQNTRFKLAELKTTIEVTRSFINDCIGLLDEGKLDSARASMAKWWSTQAQCDVMDECLQLFGGYGYMLEYPIAHAYADARVQKIYGGTNEIMKELIARSLDG